MSATEKKEVPSGTLRKAQKIEGGVRILPHQEISQDEAILHLIQQQVQDETNAPVDTDEVRMLLEKGHASQHNPRVNPSAYFPPSSGNPTMVPEGNHGVGFPKT
jgi:hypothetical protein